MECLLSSKYRFKLRKLITLWGGYICFIDEEIEVSNLRK